MDPQDEESERLERWLDTVDPATFQDAQHFRAVRAAAARVGEAQEDLAQSVLAARRAGDSWTVIAAAVGVSPQEAEDQFGPEEDDEVAIQEALIEAAEGASSTLDEVRRDRGLVRLWWRLRPWRQRPWRSPRPGVYRPTSDDRRPTDSGPAPGTPADDAQAEYDSNPELRELLHRAMSSPSVRRGRRKRRDQ